MKNLILLPVFATISAVAAEPEISAVSTFTQGEDRIATIKYTLTGEPAVITFSVETNAGDNVWVKVPDSAVARAVGDVNKIVLPSDAERTITWIPDVSWPMQRNPSGVRVEVKAWATNSPPDYMAINLVTGRVRYYVSSDAVPDGVGDRRYKTDWLLMRRIHTDGNYFRFGRGIYEQETFDVGMNQYSVPRRIALTKDYYMAVYETTQTQYLHLFGIPRYKNNALNVPCAHPGELKPVEHLTSSMDVDAVEGIDEALSSFNSNRSLALRLPNEAEWEYACRAGTRTALHNGSDTDATDIAWVGVGGEEGDGTHEVGLKKPNDWGLYDMIGNVWELCSDVYVDIPYADGAVDPAPVAGSGYHTRRGGSYYNQVHQWCNSAGRYSHNGVGSWWGNPGTIGFRLSADAVAVK